MISNLKKIARFLEKQILWCLPHKMAHKIFYYRKMKKKLNLKEPKDLNEKIQYLMLNKYGKRETELADKYKVRNYIKQKGYEDLLPRLYGTYQKVDDIDYEKLPNQFVLKANNGCGGVIICLDKNKLNIKECNRNLKKALKKNFAKESLEYHYKNIKPLIICEEYINDGTGKNPIDYKINCFDGNAKCILVCSDRDKDMRLRYYDLNWNYLDYTAKELKSKKEFEKPKNLKEMIKIAEDLSKDFPYVRVDLYNAKGKIYFGELTFTPSAGMIHSMDQNGLNELGKLINLEKIN